MDLSDVTPRNFFRKVTFQSDPTPGNKLVVPNGDFVIACMLLLISENIKKK